MSASVDRRLEQNIARTASVEVRPLPGCGRHAYVDYRSDVAMAVERLAKAKHQKGETLLLTLLALLVLFVSFLYVSSGAITNAKMAGNTLARQADLQVTDLALRQFQSTIATASGGQALQLAAASQPWYRDVSVTPGSATPSAPDLNYWKTCATSTDVTARCQSQTMSVGSKSYVVSYFIEPTGRSDPNGCGGGVGGPNASQLTAVYYDIYMNVAEAAGVSSTAGTSTTTETVYKLCVNF